MGKRILVTGGSGYIAGQTIMMLLERGYTVRATVRSKAKEQGIRKQAEWVDGGTERLEFAVADLLADDGWDAAMQGCDAVFHMASPFPMNQPKDEMQLIKPAREGTLRVLAAADRAGIKRVVLTSSLAAVTYGQDGREGYFTETDWTNAESDDVTAYVKSKTLAEKAAWEFVDGKDLELSVINPGLVLGPVMDKGHGTSVDLILRLMKGKLPGLPNFGFCIVDVRDVAEAHIKALEVPEAAGERFCCADRWMMFPEVADFLKENFPEKGKKVPTRRLPDWLVRIAGIFDPAAKSSSYELGKKRAVDNAKMKRVLQISPIPAEEAIRATAESLIKLRMV